MRRLCISLVLVPSLLAAATPVQAGTLSHRHEARAAGAHKQVTTKRLTHKSTPRPTQKYTYGRT